MNLKDMLPGKKKAWIVDSEVEASLFSGILEEEGVEFEFFPAGDGILGQFQSLEKGYGYFQCLPEYETRMEELFQAFRSAPGETDGATD